MNLIDLLVLLLGLALGVRGLRRGFALEGIEAASAVGGILFASYVWEDAGARLAIATGLPLALARGATFVLVAFLIAGAGFGLASLISGQIARSDKRLAFVDGLLGMIFGTGKGLLYAALFVVLAMQLPYGFISDWTFGSLFCRTLFALLPDLYRSLDGWI